LAHSRCSANSGSTHFSAANFNGKRSTLMRTQPKPPRNLFQSTNWRRILAAALTPLLLAAVVQPAPAALELYWALDGDAADTSGNTRDGALVGDVTWDPGVTPAALAGISTGSFLFDGSAGTAIDAIIADGTVTGSTAWTGVTGTGARTMSAWIKTPTPGNGINQTIMSWGQNVGSKKWVFRIQDSNGTEGAIRVEVNGGFQVGDTPVTDNGWHHVAATWTDDGSPNVQDVKLYLDGQLQGISASQSKAVDTASSSNVRIGANEAGANGFVGNMDDAAVWSEVLTAGQIYNLSQGNRTPLTVSTTTDIFFDNDSADGLWTTEANWGLAGDAANDVRPTIVDNTYIGNGDTVAVGAIDAEVKLLRVGHDNANSPGVGTLDINHVDAILTVNQLRIGQGTNATTQGTVNFTSGTINANVTSGSAEAIYVGHGDGAVGEFIMGTTGGNDADTTLNYTGGRFEVSQTGGTTGSTGTFTLKSGTVTGNENFIIGQNGGSATVNIEGGSFTTSTNMNFNSGTGNYNQSGGTVSVAQLNMSNQTGMTSTIAISGGKLSVGARLDDRNGTGVINLSGTGELDFSGSTDSIREVETLTMGGTSVMRFGLTAAGTTTPLSIVDGGVTGSATFTGSPAIELAMPSGPVVNANSVVTWIGGTGDWDGTAAGKWQGDGNAAVLPSDGANAIGPASAAINVITSTAGLVTPGVLTTTTPDFAVTSDANNVGMQYTGAGIGFGAAKAVINSNGVTVTRNADLLIVPGTDTGVDAAALEVSDGTLNLASSANLILGGSAKATVTQNGGVVTISGALQFGPAAGNKGGTYDLNGGELNVGSISETDANVDSAQLHLNGGTFNPTGNILVQRFSVAEAAGSTNTYTVPTTGVSITTTGTFATGEGTGVINVGPGAIVSAHDVIIGQMAGGDGTLNLSGGAFDVTHSNGTRVGYDGKGAMNITGPGGHSLSTITLGVNNNANSDGTMTIDLDGEGNTITSSKVIVGSHGKGTLNLIKGTLTSNAELVLADNTNATAANGRTATVNIGRVAMDTNPTLNVTNNLENGRVGTGVLNMYSGTINMTANNNWIIGQTSTGNATFNMYGGLVDFVSDPDIGSNGILKANSGDGVVNMTGGKLMFKDIEGANNSAGSSVYNFLGGEVVIEENLDFRNNGADTVNLDGGTLDLTGGIIHFGNRTGTNLFDFKSGVLKNVATFNGDLTQQGGRLVIGNSPGTMTIAPGTTQLGDFTMQGGDLEIEIDGLAGAGAVGGHDQLIVAGTVDLWAGSNLDLIVNATTLTVGDQFTIIDGGSQIGFFDAGTSITSGAYTFDILYNQGASGDVVLELAAVPEPSTCTLATLCLVGLLGIGRRRRR
jgi:hypothetical protein